MPISKPRIRFQNQVLSPCSSQKRRFEDIQTDIEVDRKVSKMDSGQSEKKSNFSLSNNGFNKAGGSASLSGGAKKIVIKNFKC